MLGLQDIQIYVYKVFVYTYRNTSIGVWSVCTIIRSGFV